METDISISLWNQPKSFYENSKIFGGQINIIAKYYFNNNFSGFVGICGKTKGWVISNPYLQENISFQLGLNYNLKQNQK